MKNKILLVADVEGWAYDDAAKNWKELLKEEYDIDIIYLQDYEPLKMTHGINRLIKQYQTHALNKESVNPEDFLTSRRLFLTSEGKSVPPIFDHEKYDGIFFFYHRAICDARLLGTPFPLDKVAVSVNNEKWRNDGERITYEHYLSGSKILVCCNSFIIDKFKKLHPNIMRISQSINENVFNIKRTNITSSRTDHRFTVGWSGNYSNKIKNFELARGACKQAGVKFVYERELDRIALNKWYNNLDAIICTSKAEGGPLMLLEAGACAIPVITTPVGLAREIIQHEKNGLIVDWNIKNIVTAINRYKVDRNERARMAKRLHKKIMDSWTYKARINEVREVFKKLCQK